MPNFLIGVKLNNNPHIWIEQSQIKDPAYGYTTSRSEIALVKKSAKSVLFFYGYAIVAGRCIFSQSEADEVIHQGHDLRGCNGAYLAIINDGESAIICTDFSGAVPIFHYANTDELLLSSSFILLADALQAKQVPLNLDIDVCKNYLVTRGANDQLYSTRTLIKEISLIPWGKHLAVEIGTGAHGARMNSLPAENHPKDYRAAVIDAAAEMVSLLDMAARISNVAEIPLTGGLDSRIVYAAARHLGSERFNVYPVRNPTDNKIARRLVGLSHDGAASDEISAGPRTPISPDLAIQRWERTNLGLYSYFEVNQALPTSHKSLKIELRGGGGEVMRPFFNDKTVQALASESDLADLHNHPLAGNMNDAQLFYLAYRNRIHFGRTFSEIERVVWRIDPMITWQMLNAARLAPPSFVANGQIYLDLLLLLHPPSSLEMFDDPSKDFSRLAFMTSEFFLQKTYIPSRTIKVGDPQPFLHSFDTKNSNRPWVASGDFHDQAAQIIVETCRDHFPGSKRAVERAVETFLSPPRGANMREFGREISKYYAISRLAQMGVGGSLPDA